MSPPIAPPPEPPSRKRRGLPLPALWRDSESRSIQIGVAATLLLHVLILLLGPHFLRWETPPHAALKARARPQQFNLKVIPPPPRPEPPPPQRFVEANPNAPANTPDKTNNFSFMNQQAAQEKPTPNHKSDMPSTQGRKDIESNQIVSGTLAKPEPVAPPPPPKPQPVTPPTPATPRKEQNPLPGYDKDLGANPTGFGSNVAKPSDNPQNVPNKVEGTPDAPDTSFGAQAAFKIDPQHPRPRPSLTHARPAIFKDNPLGTDNMGITALDSRFNTYGVYLHRMLEVIQVEWDRIIESSRIYPPPGTSVRVKFRLDSDGKIEEILDHASNSSEQGTNACISAITNPSPYDKWTPDMIQVIGDHTDLEITFYYIGE